MIRKIIGYFFQLVGALFFLSILIFILAIISCMIYGQPEAAVKPLLCGCAAWGLGYFFYKTGGKILSYDRPNKESLSFHLDSPFKRVMFVVSILSFFGLIAGFIANGFDIDELLNDLFRDRYLSFEIILLRTCFYSFLVSIILMLFGEKVCSWIKNGSNGQHKDRK